MVPAEQKLVLRFIFAAMALPARGGKLIKVILLLFVLSSCAAGAGQPPATATPDVDWMWYEGENGRFSVFLHSSRPLEEFQQPSLIDGIETTVYGVQASYYENERQAVTYFVHPSLESDTLTANAYLDNFELNRFGANVSLENVQESDLLLHGHPAKEWIFQLSDASVTQLDMRIRVYVVGTAVYQLTTGSLSGVTGETTERFLNSFTLNSP